MEYWIAQNTNIGVLSIDNIRVSFVLSADGLYKISEWYNSDMRAGSSDYPVNTSPYKYKIMRTIRYNTDASMTFAYFLNGTKEDFYKGMIDFNPNKVFMYNEFWNDFRTIKSFCEHFEIIRTDVALDMPYYRNSCILERGRKSYTLQIRSREERTEYLGVKNTVGYVKLYNKAYELDLPFQLTRLEITCEPNSVSYLRNFPKLSIVNAQMNMDYLALKDTDRFILMSILDSMSAGTTYAMERFNELGRKKKEKIRPFLDAVQKNVQINYKDIEILFNNMYNKL